MNAQCAICTRGLDLPGVPQPGNNRATRLCTIPCGHIFHENCLIEWWRQIIHSTEINAVVVFTCPVCRNVQDDPVVFRVFPSFSEAGTGGAELQDEIQVLRDSLRNQDVVIRRLRGNLFRAQFKPCTHQKRNMARSQSAPP